MNDTDKIDYQVLSDVSYFAEIEGVQVFVTQFLNGQYHCRAVYDGRDVYSGRFSCVFDAFEDAKKAIKHNQNVKDYIWRRDERQKILDKLQKTHGDVEVG